MSFLGSPELFPFLISAGLVAFLLLLELLLLTTGLSSAGNGTDLANAPDLEVDVTTMSAPELAAELDLPDEIALQIEADLEGYDVSEPDTAGEVSGPSAGGILDILGIRKVPLTVWLALFCALFAGTGLVLQTALWSTLGWMLPRIIAVPLALVPSLAFTRSLAGLIARLIPRDETSAISERSLGRRRGVITVGTARRGSPAQVRITDGFGNTHYAMLEPLSDSDAIAEGAEVLVLRLPRGELRLVGISERA